MRTDVRNTRTGESGHAAALLERKPAGGLLAQVARSAGPDFPRIVTIFS